MAPHSSTLAWKIPWMEEPGRLQSKGSLRVRHDCETSLSCIGEGNANPLQCSCLENPRDRGVWWAAVYGVAQSRTRLKRLSSKESKHAMTELLNTPKQSCLFISFDAVCFLSSTHLFHHLFSSLVQILANIHFSYNPVYLRLLLCCFL